MTNNIVLIGFMGSGKTTVGKVLARELAYRFVDTDDLVEASEGMTIPKIFETKGEETFRKSETAALSEAIGRHHGVISTGGGIVTIKANKAILRRGTVVYLEASPEQVYNNVKNDTSRPLLQGGDVYEKICKLLKEREVLYKDAAHYTVKVDNRTPQEIATLILGGIR